MLLRSRLTPALTERLRTELRDSDVRGETADAAAVLWDLLWRIVA
jgi:hypothetical protein